MWIFQNTFASTETQRQVKPLRMIDEVCFEMADKRGTQQWKIRPHFSSRNPCGGLPHPKFTKLTRKETKMEKFTDVFAEITRPLAKVACAMFIAFLIGGISYCFASEPTALEREKARVQWISENGEYQKNLTEEGEKQARAYVSIKQAEINKE